jgi:hypothetical protein
MANETKTEVTREGGFERRVEMISRIADPMPTKAFRLKAGARHMHDGQFVRAGDLVYLTKSQAQAFRDKFEPVDGSGFEVQSNDTTYRRSNDAGISEEQKQTEENVAALRKAVQEGEGVTTNFNTGLPVPQPPVVVPQREPAVQRPLDVHATDPDRQGQQSREQRDIIDSGNSPLPTSVQEPTEDSKRTSQPAQGGLPGTPLTTGNKTAEPQTGGDGKSDKKK